MATEQQHANGALSFDEFYQMVAICNRYHNTTMAEYNAFAAKADVDSLLAKRPASYTPEEISAALDFAGVSIWRQGLILQRLARLTEPPKTVEERVVVEFITQQSAWVVKRDGKIVADGLEQEVAHWCRNGLIAAKGK